MKYRCRAYYWSPNCCLGDRFYLATRPFRFKWLAVVSAVIQFGRHEITSYEVVE